MRNLLSMLAVSTLIGTSVGNLKPLFANNVINHGFKSNQINNKDISIKNEKDINPFIPLILKENSFKSSTFFSLKNGNVYVGTKDQGLYKSTDGINFEKMINGISSDAYINSITASLNGNVYVGTNGEGLYKSTDGINFEKMINGISSDDFITSVVIAPNGVIYAGNGKGAVYKSTDGSVFTEMYGIISAVQSLAVDSNNNIYAGTTNASGDIGTIYKSNGTDEFTKATNTNGAVQSLAVDSNNNIYAGTRIYKNNNGAVYKSTDGSVFTEMYGIISAVQSLAVDSNNNIYAGTIVGLYKSNISDSFVEVKEVPNDDVVNSVLVDTNGVIYVGTQNKGFYTINPINLLLKIIKPDTFDKFWPLYSGIVYNSVQKIDIKENLVANATLDGKSITVPTTDLDLQDGEHTLILTLKDKTLASVFGGDVSTGKITYKLWVKTSIDKKDIKYSTNTDDTELYTGLVSNAGNTNGLDIIQTKNKNISVHQATLNSKFDDILINYPNSYYVQGTVNETTNDFTATGSKQKINKNLSIKTDGIYQLHLVDTVGNTYDSYLELGKSNWKLKGTFNNDELNELARKLNVTVNLTDTTRKAKALGWLHQYENFVENKFNETIKTNGKGFYSEIKKEITSYTAFLKPLIYDIANAPKFDDGLDNSLLVDTITKKVTEILNKGLDVLPKNLNIDTRSVINKSTLDNYSIWINGYQKFINDNKDRWISDVVKVASRGFATNEQENQIKRQVSQFLNKDNIKNYLKDIVWEDNKLLKATSSGYQQYVKLEKLKNDTIDWVNTNMKDIDITYQNVIKNAESGLNLHGYSIDTLLNGKSKPQTKIEIDNFSDGQSYHDWLQSQANIKFRGWQLAMGFGIGIPFLLVVVAVAWVIRSRTNPKYNPIARGRQFDKNKKKENQTTKNDNKKEN